MGGPANITGRAVDRTGPVHKDRTVPDSSPERSELLRDLARRCGLAIDYIGWDGRQRAVSEDTLEAVLRALDHPVDTVEELRAEIAATELAPWRDMLPPVVVTRAGRPAEVAVHVPHGAPAHAGVVLEDGVEIDLEQLDVWVDPRTVDGVLTGRATFAIPTDLPLGWHTIRAGTEVDGEARIAETPLAVTPDRLDTADHLGDRLTGITTQLYSVRSTRSRGVGDFADLADLATIFGSEYDTDFVSINPVHAGAPPVAPFENSPYLPTSRRFVDPLYIRIEDIPEYGYLNPKVRAGIAETGRRFAHENVNPRRIKRSKVLRAKYDALAHIHQVPRSAAREYAYRSFLEREGESLELFAIWCVLRERLGADDPRWAQKAADPSGEWVRKQAAKHADRVDFYRWLQWVTQEQLATAQAAAREAGMRIGIVHDLAVGVASDGADAWALADTLARSVTVGAPPDVFNQMGQNWSQPPWRPDRLAQSAYRPFRDMIAAALRHAGGLRVDHILGLFRLWWIPAGMTPEQGTYVYYDHDALIGILALEAQQAGAVIIGEDLGVFEGYVQQYLSERGLLGTSILWFEHDDDVPRPPEVYRNRAMTAVTTHDLPPTAGYLAGEHITLRDRLGLLERPVEEELALDAKRRNAVLDLARQRGLLSDEEAASTEGTIVALHRLIACTPSLLVAAALVDTVGEHRTQNQPGTDERMYPNWCIPLADADGKAVSVEQLSDNPRVRAVMAALAGSEAVEDPSP
ncbi:4-alpha-glucanotransferase [Millisia brevis]|uniref:4-alpha-glucanotransferase n=1 Tax=Millisia brevis TaxID=264148 RepID=UPI000A050F6E